MSFSYGLVSRGNVPLCQLCNEPGNFDLYYQKVLSSYETEIGKPFIFQFEQSNWGILREQDGLTFLCVTHVNDQEMIATFLNEFKARFLRFHPSDWKTARTFEFQADFEPQISNIIHNYSFLFEEAASIQENTKIDDDQDQLVPLIAPDGFSLAKKKTINWAIITLIVLLLLVATYVILYFACGGFDIPNCI